MTARVGLVLGGGGVAATAWHAGVLTALHEMCGWDARAADLIVGTSGGAVTAASLRAGLPPADLADSALGRPLSAAAATLLAPLWASWAQPAAPAPHPARSFRRGAALAALARRPWRARTGLVTATLAPAGRLPLDEIIRLGDLLLPAGFPSAPLWLPAVRVADLSRVTFGRSGAPATTPGRALAASCAVPGLFTPVQIAGEAYVDGGAFSPTNLDLVADAALGLTVVSAPMSVSKPADDLKSWPPNAATRYLQHEVRRVRAAGSRVSVFAPTVRERLVLGQPASATYLRDIATMAYAAAQRRLASPQVCEGLALIRPAG